jgi:hypothetical protein
MVDIKELPGITQKEAKRLRAARIMTTDKFWREVGQALRNGLDKGRRWGLSHNRLVELLWLSVGQDAENGFKNTASAMSVELNVLVAFLATESARESRAGVLQRHGPCILTIMGVGLLVAVLVCLRLWVPSRVGWREPTVIAAQDLETGQVLRQDDLIQIPFERHDDHFVDTKSLEGTRLAMAVLRGRPLRHSDVLRPQVVATRDLHEGAIITRDAVRVIWSAYDPEATLRLEEVIGHRAIRALKKDTAVLAGSYDPTAIEDRPPGMQMLTIAVGGHVFPLALVPPTTVNLLLSPRVKKEQTAPSLVIKEVMLLDIQKKDELYVLVVRLASKDALSLLPHLSSSDVSVLSAR